MNYLAHAYLAKGGAESLIGNLMGDFVKGVLKDQYSGRILDGIRQHRKIDAFADAHPCTLASRRRFSPGRRRFAGIIVDVCYDHFLAKHWSLYSTRALPAFNASVYRVLRLRRRALPERMADMARRMIDEDWLGSYVQLDGVDRALNRISKRLKYANTLTGSVEEIVTHYGQLEADFLEFFPWMIRYARNSCVRGDAPPESRA